MEADAIAGWARYPGLDPQITSKFTFKEWFPVWWSNMTIGKWYFAGCILSAFYIIYQIIKKNIFSDKKWIFISVISGVLFWFFTAPDLRFSIGFIFLLLIIPLFVHGNNTNENKLNVKRGKLFIAVLYVLLLVVFAFDSQKIINDNIFPTWISGRWKLPKSLDYVGRSNIDSFSLNGHVLYFPKKMTETIEDRCYDHCLPCIPSKDTGIGFRGQKIEDGFYRKACIR